MGGLGGQLLWVLRYFAVIALRYHLPGTGIQPVPRRTRNLTLLRSLRLSWPFLPSSPHPRLQLRQPPRHIPAVFLILRAKHPAQRWFLVSQHKQMHSQNYQARHRDRWPVRPPKHQPKPGPSCKESHVHRITHIAVEPHHHQPPRRSDRRRRSVSCAPKVPHTPQCHRKPQHRRRDRDPAPSPRSRCVHMKPQPSRQQPEPQSEESRAHQ
jgi:hypothetical protein